MNLSLSLINLKKQVFAMMLLSICIMANIAYAGGVADGFEKREKYKNATRLGNPKKYEKLIKKDEDVTHLKNLTDNGLFDGGARELKGSEMGLFLTKSEEKKIEAKEQYQINSDNQYLKDSIAISRDPMSKTGGGSLSVQECHESAPFKKKCIEGVNFEVDVGRELVLDAHEEEYLSPEKSEKKEIALHGGWIWHNYPGWLYPIKWKKGRYGLHMRQGHPVVMAELRVHISQATNTPIENINPHIDFEPRGEGHTSNVHDDLNVFHIYRIHYTVKWQDTLKKLVEDGQYWQPVTEDMDKLVESHQCHEVGRECIKSGSKTFFDKYEISRPCWYEKVTFKCKSEPVGGCLHLSKKGCNLKDSVCKERLGSICLKWEREYICGGKKTRLRCKTLHLI